MAYEPELRDSAGLHLEAAIHLGAPNSLPPKDQELIDTARQIIGAQALDERLYKRMQRFFKPQPGADFNLIKTVGISAAGIFNRPSGQSLNQGVDALYTRQGYVSYFLAKLPEQKPDRLKSGIKLGDGGHFHSNRASELNSKALLQQVRQLYVRDYIRSWDTYLKDVQILKPAQFDQAVDLARVLASPQSPLKKFLEGVSTHTRLASAMSKAGEKTEALANQKANQALSPNVALLAGSDFKPVDFEVPLEQQVDDHFSDINNLFEGNPPAYAQVATLLNDLYAQLAAVSSAKKASLRHRLLRWTRCWWVLACCLSPCVRLLVNWRGKAALKGVPQNGRI